MLPRVTTALVALSFAPLGTGRPAPLDRYEATRLSMGCMYAVEAYGLERAGLSAAVADALDEIDRIDRVMSNYKADSELSRVNRDAGHHPVELSPELYALIADAMRYWRVSDGAFDITVGPLMKAWGFFRGEGRMPSDEELASARRHVGAQHVTLDPVARTIAFDDPGVELDLGGIAKGYAVDRAIAVLRRHNIAGALVSSGGSTIYGLGAPPGSDGWDVAIQDPSDSRSVAMTVHLNDRALSVAGSSEKYFEAGGTRYSHIMDPRTGRPVQGILGAAVLTDTGTAGDALDDALFVLGPSGAQRLLDQTEARTQAFLFLPDGPRSWKMVELRPGHGT